MTISKQKAKKIIEDGITFGELVELIENDKRPNESKAKLNDGMTVQMAKTIFLNVLKVRDPSQKVEAYSYSATKGKYIWSKDALTSSNVLREFG